MEVKPSLFSIGVPPWVLRRGMTRPDALQLREHLAREPALVARIERIAVALEPAIPCLFSTA
jgi:hypothetical protein